MMDRELDVSTATANQDAAEADYRDFLEELEEDMLYRKNVNIYFSERATGCLGGGNGLQQIIIFACV